MQIRQQSDLQALTQIKKKTERARNEIKNIMLEQAHNMRSQTDRSSEDGNAKLQS